MSLAQNPVVDLVTRAAALPLAALVRRAGAEDTVLYETARWAECLQLPHVARLDGWTRFGWFVARLPEFRSLVHYRIRKLPFPVRFVAKRVWRPEPTLFIFADEIGRGLFIHHGFATIITAASLGEDCWVNQQVTIGHRGAGKPVIGDRVRIAAGAIVLGGIDVGDDARVGAGALVVKSVPAGATMVAPAAVTLEEARAGANR
jgi:serine O-acetyltransferase